MSKFEESKESIVRNKNLQIRSLLNKDKTRLVKWLSNPEVLQYYEGRDNPFDLEKMEREFFKGEDDVTRCLVEFDGTPIGYVQYYEIDVSERKFYGYAGSKDVIYGMDQFIGEVVF